MIDLRNTNKEVKKVLPVPEMILSLCLTVCLTVLPALELHFREAEFHTLLARSNNSGLADLEVQKDYYLDCDYDS